MARALSSLLICSALAFACTPEPWVAPPPGVDSGVSGGLLPLEDPCLGADITALALGVDGWGSVGCSSGRGLWITTDAGASFQRAHPSPRLDVHGLLAPSDGQLLLCGLDRSGPASPLLQRWSARRGWEVLLPGASAFAPQLGDLSACGSVASDGEGGLLLADAWSGRLAYSPDGGRRWRSADGWLLPDGAQADGFLVFELRSAAGGWCGLGSGLSGPMLFLASGADGAPSELSGLPVDPDQLGDLLVLDSPDGGQSWLVGGRDMDPEPCSQAVPYRSGDGGHSWRSLPLPETAAAVRDLAFSEDGRRGVLVGERCPAHLGGFVLTTRDAGAHWRELPVSAPPLRVVSVLDAGFVVAGRGFLARGWLP